MAGDIDPARLDARHAAFHAEVNAFVANALPDDIRAKVAGDRPLARDDYVRWQRVLAARGWIAPGWPERFGGCDWTPLERFLFDEACVAHDAPFPNPFGLFRVAPVLVAFGTPAQQARYLPRIHASDDWWCQGYSEPDAGSDLAALRTAAVRDGDHYVVTGRKIWTTNAHIADRMFALVRTSREPRRQDGISFLLVDMRSPGITVRPIVTLDGLHHVNEVVFDAVRVPVVDRVGDEGQGWACSKVLLGFERFQIAEVPQSKRLLRQVKRLAARARRRGRPLVRDPAFAARLARAEIALAAHAATTLAFLARFQRDGAIGPEVSMLKVRGAEVRQRLAALALESLGTWGAGATPDAWDGAGRAAWPGPAEAPARVAHFFYSRGASIYGGSNEIQRDLLARSLAG